MPKLQKKHCVDPIADLPLDYCQWLSNKGVSEEGGSGKCGRGEGGGLVPTRVASGNAYISALVLTHLVR